MSHGIVLVLTDNSTDVDDQLEPYWELDLPDEVIEDDPRAEWVPREDLKSLLEQWNKYIETDRAMLIEKYPKDSHPDYQTLVEFIKGYYGGGLVRDPEGSWRWGYWTNPNAKWDWFTVGGRWEKEIILKNGDKVDSAPIEDIDPKFLRNFVSHAIITLDGEWREYGEMGWFASTHVDGTQQPPEIITDQTFKEYILANRLLIDPDVFVQFCVQLFGPDSEYTFDLKEDQFTNNVTGETTKGEDFFAEYLKNHNEGFPDYRQSYLAKLAAIIGNHYNRNGDRWELNDIDHAELRNDERFCWLGWKDRFYRDFIEPLDGDVCLTIVDYHI
jgi:hypothetical protein